MYCESLAGKFSVGSVALLTATFVNRQEFYMVLTIHGCTSELTFAAAIELKVKTI